MKFLPIDTITDEQRLYFTAGMSELSDEELAIKKASEVNWDSTWKCNIELNGIIRPFAYVASIKRGKGCNDYWIGFDGTISCIVATTGKNCHFAVRCVKLHQISDNGIYNYALKLYHEIMGHKPLNRKDIVEFKSTKTIPMNSDRPIYTISNPFYSESDVKDQFDRLEQARQRMEKSFERFNASKKPTVEEVVEREVIVEKKEIIEETPNEEQVSEVQSEPTKTPKELLVESLNRLIKSMEDNSDDLKVVLKAFVEGGTMGYNPNLYHKASQINILSGFVLDHLKTIKAHMSNYKTSLFRKN